MLYSVQYWPIIISETVNHPLPVVDVMSYITGKDIMSDHTLACMLNLCPSIIQAAH